MAQQNTDIVVVSDAVTPVGYNGTAAVPRILQYSKTSEACPNRTALDDDYNTGNERETQRDRDVRKRQAGIHTQTDTDI